jgi:nitroimidazol reductase NimA-like FMN-containing flavoprotein (pyridoxamine 5'-phosphate oxidase superfamily)
MVTMNEASDRRSTMDQVMEGPKLAVLSRDECLSLLASRGVGRIAVAASGAAPMVVPVNYLLDGQVVVFRSGPGSKLQAMPGTPISFQVDEIDSVHRTGWSVLVRGRGYEATRWETDHLDLQTWVPGDKGHWVRIVPDAITGRKILVADQFTDLGGYL